jgi:4-hydroxythreonine-4-phosphate dehydrogenase
MGDPSGIGGELIAKSLKSIATKTIPVIVGDSSVLRALPGSPLSNGSVILKPLGEAKKGEGEIVDLGVVKDVRFGETDAACGEASYRYILEALKLLFSGVVSAVVTCPINKRSIRSAGIPFIGHTEMFAHYTGTTQYVMMMACRRLRVSLVTIHIPLKDVPALITPQSVLACIAVTDRALRNDFGIENPYIKVCGLNPHAGESGVMGHEEASISGAIAEAKSRGIGVDGPYPGDSLFHRIDCDAYVAMYHDQGLIPVKTLDFRRTVNITLGLPVVRTSVGHGTGLDIAGKGLADPTSLIEAYRVAELMAKERS